MNNPSFTVVPLKIFDFALIDFYTLISLLKLDDILIKLPSYASYNYVIVLFIDFTS